MTRIVILSSLALFMAVALALAQEKDKPEKKPSVEEVEAKYGPQIKRLDGVAKVGLAKRGEEEFIVIDVLKDENRELLDNLLSDEIEGYGVMFEVTGEPLPGDPDTAKDDKPKPPDKGTPLCFKCTGPKYPAKQGLCKECGGWTKSTDFKYCDECARKLGICARCGRSFKQGK